MRWALLAASFLATPALAKDRNSWMWSVVASDWVKEPYASILKESEARPMALIVADPSRWDVIPFCDSYLVERPVDLYPDATPEIYRLKNAGNRVALAFWTKPNQFQLVAPHTARVWECVEGLLP